MPTNLYGPNDNYDLKNSHVLPALLRKFHEAKVNNEPSVLMWGTGSPKREFLHVDDLADACFYLMENYNEAGLVNIGTGTDVSILELAQAIKKIVGYKGKIEHDLSKPDGTPRKLMNVDKLKNLGWSAKIGLDEGIKAVYESVDKIKWVSNLEFDNNTSKESLFANVGEFIERLGFSIDTKDDQRPWGGFYVIAEKNAAKFIQYFFPEMNMGDFEGYTKLSPKILLVAPEKRLSWQYHHRRAELWRVVGGTASVVISDTDEQTKPYELSLGEIVQLKQGQRHRLLGTNGWGMVAEIWKHTDASNPSNEDDIVRVEDDFGR